MFTILSPYFRSSFFFCPYPFTFSVFFPFHVFPQKITLAAIRTENCILLHLARNLLIHITCHWSAIFFSISHAFWFKTNLVIRQFFLLQNLSKFGSFPARLAHYYFSCIIFGRFLSGGIILGSPLSYTQ
jgi:hypothetical protein